MRMAGQQFSENIRPPMSPHEKLNCWEFNKCGREPGGEKANDMGTCPVTIERKLDGIHEGKNAGRACWIIVGTLCKGKVPETFFEKYRICVECDFYNKVREEEGIKFILAPFLLKKVG